MTKFNLTKITKLIINWKSLLFVFLGLILLTIFYILPNYYIKPLILNSYNLSNLPTIEYQLTSLGTFEKPVIATLIPNGQDNYQIIYSEHIRKFLFLFEDTNSFRGNKVTYQDYSSVIGSVNKSVGETKQIVAKYDLTKYNPEPTKINTVYKTTLPPADQEYADKKYLANLPENSPFDRIDLDPNQVNRSLEDYQQKLKLDMTAENSFPLFKFEQMGGIVGGSLSVFPKEDRMTETQILISNNPRVKFFALKEACLPFEEDRYCDQVKGRKLKAVNIVLKDRTIIPVPVNDQGYFDFEAVKGKWE